MPVRPLAAPAFKVLSEALFFMPVCRSDVVSVGRIALNHVECNRIYHFGLFYDVTVFFDVPFFGYRNVTDITLPPDEKWTLGFTLSSSLLNVPRFL